MNECELNTAICGIGTCINTEGNYTCVCPDGHLLMPDRNCMDMRKGNCYRRTYNDSRSYPYRLVCEQPIQNPLTKKQCCCSIGQGWDVSGGPCEPCPRPFTPEFNLLCVSTGQVINPDTGLPKG